MMIERVARAICEARSRDNGTTWRSHVEEAIAAIRAMREPDARMKELLVHELSDVTVGAPKARAWDALRGYTAMIDAILAEIEISEEEQRHDAEVEERRQLENEEMARYYEKHPHG